ncbi:hypothetical protein B0H14DRAFT_2578054 [Mycena olivaceomarginata]|nr:hypothetical protein B0H14DRAFT_2578054 [Mycena olivaceomarginata]
MFSESLEIRQHSTSCGTSGACVGGVAVAFWCSRCSGSGLFLQLDCFALLLFICGSIWHPTMESQGCCSHPDLARMEILSMITNSKHLFLSYYYFAWGHSILVTLSRRECIEARFPCQEKLQTWAAGLRFLSEQVLRTENSSSFFKMRDIVRDPILHLPFDGRRSRGECGPLRRMNQSRCGGGVLALELEADIKAPAFETSAVHTIVAAFVHVVKGTGLQTLHSKWDRQMCIAALQPSAAIGRTCMSTSREEWMKLRVRVPVVNSPSMLGMNYFLSSQLVHSLRGLQAKLVLVCHASFRVKADGHLARTSTPRI